MPYINAIDDNRNDEPGLFWLPLSGWRCVSAADDDDDASVTHSLPHMSVSVSTRKLMVLLPLPVLSPALALANDDRKFSNIAITKG